MSSINGVFDGLTFAQSIGGGPQPPHAYGSFSITPFATFEPGVAVNETLTVPANFLATIHTGSGFDLLFPGSGTAALHVDATPPGQVIFSVGSAGTFSGFVQVPEQAQIPEPAAWQLTGLALLFPLWRRVRAATQDS